jgi:prepilin-type N-terminal cleavage/methylation domain-containing protein
MTAFAKTIPVLDTSKPSIKQKGYSIIELSIALAIISIILVTALATYRFLGVSGLSQ